MLVLFFRIPVIWCHHGNDSNTGRQSQTDGTRSHCHRRGSSHHHNHRLIGHPAVLISTANIGHDRSTQAAHCASMSMSHYKTHCSISCCNWWWRWWWCNSSLSVFITSSASEVRRHPVAHAAAWTSTVGHIIIIIRCWVNSVWRHRPRDLQFIHRRYFSTGSVRVEILRHVVKSSRPFSTS